jgi:hypothetical protein
MAQANLSPRLIGTVPKAFDGKADKAISFWNSLENYYHLNATTFNNDPKKVSMALTYFKLGTQAREWASDRIATAQAGTQVDYGTWPDFKDAFKAQFIPPETQQDAIIKIYNLPMGNREFNEWYQEWSQYAHRTNVDDATKMFAFRKALNGALQGKMMLLSPQPTTLARLVDKAREFNKNWRIFANTGNTPQTPHRNTNVQVREVTRVEAPNVEINSTRGRPLFKKRGRLTPREREHHIKNNLCLYCGKEGHKAIECRAPPNKCPGTKLRQVEMIPEEGTSQIDLLDESGLNKLSANSFAPLLMDTDDIMETFMNTSF